MFDGLSFHDRQCHCRDCLWQRIAERADEEGLAICEVLERALKAAECENADVQHYTRVDDANDVTHRFEFAFAIAGLDVEEDRRVRHIIARVFRAAAAEMEREPRIEANAQKRLIDADCGGPA
jgi:hypothetical protein